MTYTHGKHTDMLNPSIEGSGEPANTATTHHETINNLDSNENGELIDYNYASVLAQFHEDALKQAGTGASQLLVLLACGLAISGATLELAVIPFILPSAEIEFCILAHEKSWLVLITLVGASLGGIGWGSLAACLGRRRALVSCLAVNAVFSTIAAFMPTYGTFMMARFCSGIGSGGIIPTVFSYLAEFCQRAHRGKVLPLLLLFMGLGGLYASGVAKAIVPATGTETLIENKEHFSAWHRYLLLCTLPILASLVTLIWTQESPRYLLEVGREVDAMMVYQNVHKCNQTTICGKRKPQTHNTNSEYRLGELELPGKRRPHAVNPVRHSVKMFWHAFFQLFSSAHRHTTLTLGGSLMFAVILQYTINAYTISYMNHLQQELFDASRVTVLNKQFANENYNRIMQNIDYENSTFADCNFTDTFMSHVTFKNCTFVRVSFAAIKTSYTSFKGCYFINSSIIDTDIESSRDLDPYCVLNGTSIRGMRVGCKRHADLTFSIGGMLTQQTANALVTVLAAPVAMLPYPYRKLFGLNVACAAWSGVLYFARAEWSLYALEAVFRFLLTLILYTVSVMIIEGYPASLRCTGHGMIMSLVLIGGSVSMSVAGSLWPATATGLCSLLAGLAAALTLRATDTGNNLI